MDVNGEPTTGAQVGDYRLLRRLGEGGYGCVWLVESVHAAGARYALKLSWRPETGQKAGGRSRRELVVLLGLAHPYIVQPFAHGLLPAREGGRPYLVMEYVKGEALDDWSLRVNPSHRELVQLFDKSLEALAYAHGRGVLHRDIKPSAIQVREDGEPRWLDWGAADALGAITLTERGLPPGTPGYRSPQAEQFAGPGAYAASPLDDLYALGVTFYVALTLVHPFPAESREQVSLATVSMTPVSPHALNPRVPVVLGEWVLRLMAKEERDRFASAAIARESLQALRAAHGIDWDMRVHAPRPARESGTEPPTSGDGPPALDAEVQVRHLFKDWDAQGSEARKVAEARRNLLLARPRSHPGTGPHAVVARRTWGRPRLPQGWWGLVALLLLALAVCGGLLPGAQEQPPRLPVMHQADTSSPAPSGGKEVVAPSAYLATVTGASALPAALIKESPHVKTTSPSSPPQPTSARRSRRAGRSIPCVVGLTLAATQWACAGAPVRPPAADCPEGSRDTMKRLNVFPGEFNRVHLDDEQPSNFGKQDQGRFHEGVITSVLLGEGVADYLMRGEITFGGDGRMYVRYTRIKAPNGDWMPFCAIVIQESGGHEDEREFVPGVPMSEGSTPQAIRAERAQFVGFVTTFRAARER